MIGDKKHQGKFNKRSSGDGEDEEVDEDEFTRDAIKRAMADSEREGDGGIQVEAEGEDDERKSKRRKLDPEIAALSTKEKIELLANKHKDIATNDEEYEEKRVLELARKEEEESKNEKLRALIQVTIEFRC